MIPQADAERGTELAELERTSGRRLNVGCGKYALRYWVNLDSDPSVRADIHQDALVYLTDCEPGRYDEIYAGHFLEHLPYEQAEQFLFDCLRVLSPGGKLGILVPDTREIMHRWLNGLSDQVEYPHGVWRRVADLDEVCHLFLYSDVQPSPHRWAWDKGTLARAMARVGFVGLKEGDRYNDPRIPVGAWYQVLIDGYKPQEVKE